MSPNVALRALAHLTHVIDTIVDVLGAVFAGKSGQAVAGVVGEVVDALAAVFARRIFVGAKRDLGLAVLAGEAPAAQAGVLADSVDAGGVVLKQFEGFESGYYMIMI